MMSVTHTDVADCGRQQQSSISTRPVGAWWRCGEIIQGISR